MREERAAADVVGGKGALCAGAAEADAVGFMAQHLAKVYRRLQVATLDKKGNIFSCALYKIKYTT